MKTKYFLGFAALALLATGCSKNNVIGGAEVEGNTISFATYVNRAQAPVSRTATSGDVTTALMQTSEEGFGVVGYHNDGTNHNIYLGAEASTASTSAAIQQTYSSTWEYATESELKYWPAVGTMDFYAYFPYGASVKIAAANGSSTTPLEITSWTDGQDVLVASALAESSADRTALTFAHAFAKINAVNLTQANDGAIKDYTVKVSEVQFLNTETTGSIKVSETGAITYGSASPTVIRTKTGLDVTASTTDANLIVATDNSYIFPASTIWDGVKANITESETLATDSKVVMVLKAKVYKGEGTAAEDYKVGGTDSYGDIYIPLGTTALEAGKRYTFNITMKNDVGYEEDGDPIFALKPIKFSATVTDWADVTAIDIVL